jgi:cell division protein FtsQ
MKPRWKVLLNYGIWAVLLITLMSILSFVGEEQEQLRCKSLDVVIKPESKDFFITRADIVREITAGQGENVLKGRPVVEFEVGKLEDKLELNPFIKDAEVFIDIQGNLRVEVWQRKPIVRIAKNSGKGFYIDEDGIKMPLSENYTAHVPIATGRIRETVKKIRDTVSTPIVKDIYTLSLFIQEHPFWEAMIEQIVVNKNNEIVLIPMVADHKVVLGDVSRLEEKLKHLKIFYKKGLNKVGWEKYKVINLKYTGQIVCEKY